MVLDIIPQERLKCRTHLLPALLCNRIRRHGVREAKTHGDENGESEDEAKKRIDASLAHIARIIPRTTLWPSWRR